MLSHDKSFTFPASLGASSKTIPGTKEAKKCWCSMKDGVFISGSTSLSQSLPHNTIHYLSLGQGKLSWGPIVCLVEFWLCLIELVTLVLCLGMGVGETKAAALDPRGKLWLQGGLSFPLPHPGLPGEIRRGDSRMGVEGWGAAWKHMNRGGAGPALALSLTGSGQCPAAEGRGLAYAHKLISSASAGPPAQSGCLHCGPRAFSC